MKKRRDTETGRAFDRAVLGGEALDQYRSEQRWTALNAVRCSEDGQSAGRRSAASLKHSVQYDLYSKRTVHGLVQVLHRESGDELDAGHSAGQCSAARLHSVQHNVYSSGQLSTERTEARQLALAGLLGTPMC